MNAHVGQPAAPQQIDIKAQLRAEALGKLHGQVIDLQAQVLVLNQRNLQLTEQFKALNGRIRELENEVKKAAGDQPANTDSPSPAAPSANEDNGA